MNAENFTSNTDNNIGSGKRTTALILVAGMAFAGVLVSSASTKQGEIDTLVKQRTTDWTKERVEKVLTYIPGAQNSEVITETIKITGGGYNLDFAIKKRENGEKYVIVCNIDDNSCSDPKPLKPHQYPNIIPSEK